MPIGKIAVVRAPLDTLLQGFEPAELAPAFGADGFAAYCGVSGGVFHAAPLDGGALIAPFGLFETAADVALAVRDVLGDALDRHDESRGLFIADGETLPEGSYDGAVGGAGAFVEIPAKDDPRLTRKEGWSFAAAASAFSSADAKKRTEERAEVDPLASAQATFDTKLAAREDRGHMRRTLSAALNHEVDHSAIGEGAPNDGEEGEDKAVGDAAEKLRRVVAANPDKVTELENVLRGAVDNEIARDEEIDESQLPPMVVADTTAEEVPEPAEKSE